MLDFTWDLAAGMLGAVHISCEPNLTPSGPPPPYVNQYEHLYHEIYDWKITRHGLLNTINVNAKKIISYNKNANPTMLHSTSRLI